MNLLRRLQSFIDSLTVRERLLILATLTALILYGGYLSLLHPSQSRIEKATRELEDIDEKQARLTQEILALLAESPAVLKKRLEEAQRTLEALDERLRRSGRQFLSADELARWLAALLDEKRGEGLSIERIESLPATRVYPPPGEGGDWFLYRKGVALAFKGNFMATWRYFQNLEEASLPILWGSFDYTVEDYPLGETRVEVYTFILEHGGGEAAWALDKEALIESIGKRLAPGMAKALEKDKALLKRH